MIVIKTYIYGWGEAPRCFDGEAIALGSNKLALVLGAEDCALVQPTLEPSDVRNIDLYRRYSDERGVLEHCFDNVEMQCVRMVSNSKNIVVYTDGSDSLWSYGLNMMGDHLAFQSPVTSSKSEFHFDQYDNVTGVSAILKENEDVQSTKKAKLKANIEKFAGNTQQKQISTENILDKHQISPKNIPEKDVITSEDDIFHNLRCNLITKNFVVKQIAAGDSHCLILDTCNVLYSFGTGSNGELGLGKIIPFTTVLQKVIIQNNNNKIDEKVKYIAAGSYYSAVITAEGCLYTFGCGAYYRLGHGCDENCVVPKRVRALDGVGLSSPNGTSTGLSMVACGVWHTVAVASDTHDVYTWGWNKFGQCGARIRPSGVPQTTLSGDNISSAPSICYSEAWSEPRRVMELDRTDLVGDNDISAVSCGSRHTAILTGKNSRIVIIGIIGSLPDVTSDTKFNSILNSEIPSKLSHARVLYDINQNDSTHNRRYRPSNGDDDSNNIFNDPSVKFAYRSNNDNRNSELSCNDKNNDNLNNNFNSNDINNNNGSNYDNNIDRNNNNDCNIIENNDNKNDNKSNIYAPNIKSEDVEIKKIDERKFNQILSIASTLWGFGFIVE